MKLPSLIQKWTQPYFTNLIIKLYLSVCTYSPTFTFLKIQLGHSCLASIHPSLCSYIISSCKMQFFSFQLLPTKTFILDYVEGKLRLYEKNSPLQNELWFNIYANQYFERALKRINTNWDLFHEENIGALIIRIFWRKMNFLRTKALITGHFL